MRSGFFFLIILVTIGSGCKRGRRTSTSSQTSTKNKPTTIDLAAIGPEAIDEEILAEFLEMEVPVQRYTDHAVINIEDPFSDINEVPADTPETEEFCGVLPAQNRRSSIQHRLDFGPPKADEDLAAGHSPWYVLLRRYEKPVEDINQIDVSNKFVECASSVIQVKNNKKRSNMLVTSARCITDWKLDNDQTVEIDPKRLLAFPIQHTTADNIEPIRILELRKHPGYKKPYNLDHHVNDTGLTKLSRSIPFIDYRRPICLPKRDEVLTVSKDNKCVMSGLEHRNHPGKDPKRARTLRQIGMKVLSANSGVCSPKAPPQWDLVICATPTTKTQKLTYNDLGASLECFDGKKWILHGSASLDDRFDTRNPYMFTRMSEFADDWIVPNANEMAGLLLSV